MLKLFFPLLAKASTKFQREGLLFPLIVSPRLPLPPFPASEDKWVELSIAAHTYNHSTQEAQAARPLVWSQLGFQVRPCQGDKIGEDREKGTEKMFACSAFAELQA